MTPTQPPMDKQDVAKTIAYDKIIASVRDDVAFTDEQIWDLIVIIEAYAEAVQEGGGAPE